MCVPWESTHNLMRCWRNALPLSHTGTEYHLWTHNTSNPEANGLQQQKTTPGAQAHQSWTIEDWKNVAWSDESRFLLRHSDGRVRICRKEHCINGSGWCWWWNGVGDIFLAHFGLLSTNWASFKLHSLPEYCFWTCPSLYDYSVPIFWWLLPAG